jgi:hypothetical protein
MKKLAVLSITLIALALLATYTIAVSRAKPHL